MNVQRQKPSEMRDTCTSIADELIFGKEIAKSVKCLKNTHKETNVSGLRAFFTVKKKTGCTQYFAIPETIPIIEASMSV